MSVQLGKLCALLLLEHFGDTIEKVGIDLFKGGPKPLRFICTTTKLNVNEVRQSLSILIKYGLVTFNTSKLPHIAEYKLHPENVVLLLRYPKYLMLMKSLYGNEAEIIVEEILRHGRDIAPSILINSLKRIAAVDNSKEAALQRLKDILEMLINKQYIKRCSKILEKKPIPELCVNDVDQFKPPKINMQQLYETLSNNHQITCSESDIFLEINYDRFHQDLRDDLLVTAVTRRTNQAGGEIMRLILQQMQFNSNPWAPISNPISSSDIKEISKKSKLDSNIIKHLEDYLHVLTEDCGGFLRKSRDISLAYDVNLKHSVIEMTWCVLSNGVDIKYGSNAARIFRLIREQKFIEQDEIQKKAMLPDKEAKFLTYSLLQSGWIQQHELKKGLQKAGPTKTFYLFHIDFEQVVRMYIETCYKSLYNAITLREQEKAENRCLLEKKQRIDAIVLHMRKEGATDEQIVEIEEMITPPEHSLLEKIHLNVNKISQAELQIDETLFILELCLKFGNQN